MTAAEPAGNWLERAPTSACVIQQKLRFVREPIERMSDATKEVDEATRIDDEDRQPDGHR